MKDKELIFIGIIDGPEGGPTYNLLKEILILCNHYVLYENPQKTISILIGDKNIHMVVSIRPKSMKALEELGIDFNILIFTLPHIEGYARPLLKGIVSKSQYFIVNSDGHKWIELLDDNIKSIIITYGFNSKASISPSSFNNQDLLETNICFQREIKTIMGKVIEPFELTIKMDMNRIDIYSIIAAISSCLVLGMDIVTTELSKSFGQRDLLNKS
ncbi:MAG: hypothetical protein WCZ27_08730 [Tissierellaceae bacterium]